MTTTLLRETKTGTDSVAAFVTEMRGLAIRALARMYRPEAGLFAFRLRPNAEAIHSVRAGLEGASGFVLEGISPRYTAMVLIGLADQEPAAVEAVFKGESSLDVCDRLVRQCPNWTNLGDVAVTLWAANRLGLGRSDVALKRLKELDPIGGAHPTVEVAWSLSALSIDPQSDGGDDALAAQIARRLIASFHPQSELFAHVPQGVQVPWHRSHIACYADLVYPIQALSHYHRRSGDSEARDIARACARRMCRLQGPDGQWWWHYDVRTGQVIEGYPVYAVHQNSMGPMALFAAQYACGADHTDAVRLGLQWLIRSPEIDGSLVDRRSGIIWRKVARHEPGKLVRGLQGVASRIHPSLRVPGLGTAFAPTWIDYESRPYHMGWILHAWGKNRETQLRNSSHRDDDASA